MEAHNTNCSFLTSSSAQGTLVIPTCCWRALARQCIKRNDNTKWFRMKDRRLRNWLVYDYNTGAPTRTKCTWDRAPNSWNMVNLFFVWLSHDWPSERTYVRTYSSTDCTVGVRETIKRKGGVSQVCLGKSTSFTLDIHNMVNWQLSKQDSHWPVSHDHIAGSCVNSSRWRDLFESCPPTS